MNTVTDFYLPDAELDPLDPFGAFPEIRDAAPPALPGRTPVNAAGFVTRLCRPELPTLGHDRDGGWRLTGDRSKGYRSPANGKRCP